jgi:hypothetical protein
LIDVNYKDGDAVRGLPLGATFGVTCGGVNGLMGQVGA